MLAPFSKTQLVGTTRFFWGNANTIVFSPALDVNFRPKIWRRRD